MEKNKQNIIVIHESDLIDLVNRLIDKAGLKQEVEEALWVTGEKAMSLLGITSKTTLYRMRVEGLITYSEVRPKNFLYSTASIFQYIKSKEKTAFNSFLKKSS